MDKILAITSKNFNFGILKENKKQTPKNQKKRRPSLTLTEYDVTNNKNQGFINEREKMKIIEEKLLTETLNVLNLESTKVK